MIYMWMDSKMNKSMECVRDKLVGATIEVSQEVGYFGSYYLGSDSVIEAIFDIVFNVEN